MKKPGSQILVLLTCIFAFFLFGFFAGRNFDRTPVTIQSLVSVQPQSDATAATTEATEVIQTGPVNINTATAAQLQTLPGIGEVLAQRIIDYREEHGPFQSVAALKKVSGIGEKRLEALWDLVTIGGS